MTAPLWTGKQIIEATSGDCAQTDWICNGVNIDNRVVEKDDLFIAIKGPNNDGHDYVKAALEAGASAALVSHVPEGVDKDKLVLVEDTQTAMEKLGEAARNRTDARIIAVTGSVGKTGTKEALAHLLSRQGKTHYSIGSFNNHWGVPLSLCRMPLESEYGIFELGMNHAGELGPLSKMVRPDVAIITIIAPAHMEFFESTDDVARAKAEIFEGVKENGVVLLNADDSHFPLLKGLAETRGDLEIRYFGENDLAHIRLNNAQLMPESSIIDATIFGQNHHFTIPLAGRHWVQNALAVLGGIALIGGDTGKACADFADLAAPSGRGALIDLESPSGRYVVIDESYNASPVAMEAAFKVLAGKKVEGMGRKIAVLGDMRELGEKSPEIHRNLAAGLLASGVDLVYASGPNMQHLYDALPLPKKASFADKSDALVGPLKQEVRADDIVLIKGSLGSNMKVILNGLVGQSDMLRKQSEGRA
ncbi:MAG: UDP-N-acetylmuramoyl-tripeptide--D-alanyl-D-alanine ligase [Sneathiellales bacterium]|nr:UDP-N-acetylmuramoyl-tripeptide--D-alanyl-D-alanine ligase [Sneathiellales bacterium]